MLSLIVPFLGTYTWLQHERHVLKKQVKRNLMHNVDQAELVLITIDIGDEGALRWEHDGEFEYQGEMYDIVERCSDDVAYYYWCWWDNEETALNRQLASILKDLNGNNPVENQGKQQLLDLSKDWIESYNVFPEVSLSERDSESVFEHAASPDLIYPDVLSPPPWVTA